MIVAIEGIDACGKGTQARMLKHWAIEHGEEQDILDVAEQHFPDYSGVAGEKIAELLRGHWAIIANDLAHKEYTKALVLQCMMVTSRLEHGSLLQAYAHNRQKLLILDRYHASARVYGQSDGLDSRWLKKIHEHFPVPDLWILLDVSVDESFRRRPERLDHYERDRVRLEDTRKLYLELFEEEGHDRDPGWFILDGNGKVEDVHEQVKQLLLDVLEA